MPELPEVETVRKGLEPHLAGARLVRVEQRRADLRFPFPDDFVARLSGATVLRLERRAKYLIAPLDTGETLVAHLGMTGRFTIEGDAPGAFHHAAGADPKHTHVVMVTDAGTTVSYNDARRFGYMELIRSDRFEDHPWFQALGPEPMGPGFNTAQLAAAIEGKAQPIKMTLLDQRIVSGLGNIYVCEALNRAGIDPRKSAGALSRKRVARLVEVVREVLGEAIEAGGSTLRDFRSAEGALGYFQHTFRVYDREDAPCPTPGCRGTVQRIVQGGRSTFFCAVCQR